METEVMLWPLWLGWMDGAKEVLSNRQCLYCLKYLRQYRCYGNQSLIGNRGGRWALWNRGDFGLSPASRENTQM